MRRLLERWLTHRHLGMHLALLAMLLSAPALLSGLAFDDYFQKAALTHPTGLEDLHRSAAGLFEFISDDHGAGSFAPWWANRDLRLAFWRPVTGFTHFVDYRWWPESPALMHLHSLVWLGLTVWAAALALRRLLGPGAAWTAGLAALFFALDDAHAWPAAWLANRNALLAAVLGFACLIAHDRQRREGWRPGTWAVPVLLLLAVLAGEAAVAAGGYLLAYAVCLDRGPWRERLLALWPATAVGLVWAVFYKLQGFGARGSMAYLDPIDQPLRFAGAVVERAPILVLGQWSPVPADIYGLLPGPGRSWMWGVALIFLLLMTALLAALVRRDPRARFCALGMALSLLPVCGIFPMNRLLLFVGFGAAGLLALLVEAAWRADMPTLSPLGDQGGETRWRFPARFIGGVLLVVQVILSPLVLLATPAQLTIFRSLELAIRAVDRRSVPGDDERAVDDVFGLRRNDQGRFDRGGVEIEVTALTGDGRPAEVSFRFATPLEDDSLRWLRWSRGAFVPFEPPGLGEVVSLPRPGLGW